jgi:5-methylcytosine-specific restriction endonuclease McrA
LKCGAEGKPQQDHIIPLAKGGVHHPTNLQPLCRKCNERKQARTVDYRTPDQRAAIAAKWGIEFKRTETR